MGAVLIQRSHIDSGDLPNLCLRCGQPATHRCTKTFSRGQDWTRSFLLGGVPSMLCQMVFRVYQRAEVPLCDRHSRHFAWQAVTLWGGLALTATLVALSFGMIFANQSEWVISRSFAASGIIGVTWAVVYMVNRLTCIAPATIDDRQMLLMGVSDRFARAYESTHRGDYESAA